MSKKLIDPEAYLARMRKTDVYPILERYGLSDSIRTQDTVEAEEIVRCRECKHGSLHGRWGDKDQYKCDCDLIAFVKDGDFFCAYGKRKDQNDE